MSTTPADERSRNLRVLVVDDSATVQDCVNTALRQLGITNITQAKDGAVAKQYFSQCMTPFDIVICGWDMPNLSGQDFLRHVRNAEPGIPFLVLSAGGSRGEVIQAKTAGATAYVTKPFSVAEIQKKVRVLTARVETLA